MWSLGVRKATNVVNAMTVDVEDYFHVSVFDGTLPRHQWTTLESRVGRNTHRLLDIFAASGVRATFFVLGWVAERFPAEALMVVHHQIARRFRLAGNRKVDRLSQKPSINARFGGRLMPPCRIRVISGSHDFPFK